MAMSRASKSGSDLLVPRSPSLPLPRPPSLLRSLTARTPPPSLSTLCALWTCLSTFFFTAPHLSLRSRSAWGCSSTCPAGSSLCHSPTRRSAGYSLFPTRCSHKPQALHPQLQILNIEVAPERGLAPSVTCPDSCPTVCRLHVRLTCERFMFITIDMRLKCIPWMRALDACLRSVPHSVQARLALSLGLVDGGSGKRQCERTARPWLPATHSPGS